MAIDPVWNKFFAGRQSTTYPSEEFIRFVARHFYQVSDRSQIKALELGCGMAPNLWYLSREGFSAYGLEASQVAIDKAKAWLQAENCRAEFTHGDVLEAANYFDVGTFDIVYDIACLQCNRIADVESTINQAFTLLKPGGWFFSLAVARGSLGDGEGEEIEPGSFVGITKGPMKDRGLNHMFTLEEMQTLLSAFTDVHIEYTLRTLDHREGYYKSWLAEGRKPL
jgi:SAM-dependent methyltransferase